ASAAAAAAAAAGTAPSTNVTASVSGSSGRSGFSGPHSKLQQQHAPTVSRAPISRSAANTGTSGGRKFNHAALDGGRGGGVEAAAARSEMVEAPTAPRRRRGRKGRSIYRGVCVTREGKWRAVIYKERKQLYLGVYESELEAAKAHDRAARFHFPDKSMTNFATEAEANRLISEQE
ncbi:unnamed protein product, partial [Laminaria digitata]